MDESLGHGKALSATKFLAAIPQEELLLVWGPLLVDVSVCNNTGGAAVGFRAITG